MTGSLKKIMSIYASIKVEKRYEDEMCDATEVKSRLCGS
jgi:hypothetical protein